MRRIIFDNKEHYVTTLTPIQLYIDGERNVTVEKVYIDGKEYVLNVNENKKARLEK